MSYKASESINASNMTNQEHRRRVATSLHRTLRVRDDDDHEEEEGTFISDLHPLLTCFSTLPSPLSPPVSPRDRHGSSSCGAPDPHQRPHLGGLRGLDRRYPRRPPPRRRPRRRVRRGRGRRSEYIFPHRPHPCRLGLAPPRRCPLRPCLRPPRRRESPSYQSWWWRPVEETDHHDGHDDDHR